MARSEFGARLEEAIKLPGRPGSIRKFQAALEARVGNRERFGYSYPTVSSYLTGSAAPTLDWVREVAELLDVRLSWLAFKDGPRTASEAQAAGNLEAEQPPEVRRFFETLKSSWLHEQLASESVDLRQMWNVLLYRVGVPHINNEEQQSEAISLLEDLLLYPYRMLFPAEIVQENDEGEEEVLTPMWSSEYLRSTMVAWLAVLDQRDELASSEQDLTEMLKVTFQLLDPDHDEDEDGQATEE